MYAKNQEEHNVRTPINKGVYLRGLEILVFL